MEVALHWRIVRTQLPSAVQRTGLPIGQLEVMHSLALARQLRSGQRCGALAGQSTKGPHSAASTTHVPSAHRWAFPSQTTTDGHLSELATQSPDAQRTGLEIGQSQSV